jgi:hypothetical protein
MKEDLHCEMDRTCTRAATHIDQKGWTYCAEHVITRKLGVPCRQLRPSEIKRLVEGGTILYRLDK